MVLELHRNSQKACESLQAKFINGDCAWGQETRRTIKRKESKRETKQEKETRQKDSAKYSAASVGTLASSSTGATAPNLHDLPDLAVISFFLR